MKKFSIIAVLFGTSLLLSACDLVEGIFKAGFVGGILVVLLVIGLIIWLVKKAKD